MPLPTPDELQAAWTDLRAIHTEYLAVHEVVIPSVENYADRNKAVCWRRSGTGATAKSTRTRFQRLSDETSRGPGLISKSGI